MRIQRAKPCDSEELAALAVRLWPGHPAAELAAEFGKMLRRTDAALFLALEGEEAVGFAQCQLRHDYVEGTETSPVGYLEGIYVAEGFRRRGAARALLSACEDWAKEKGCREFASDCELDNTKSLAFHLHAGFEEANRIICFAKKL